MINCLPPLPHNVAVVILTWNGIKFTKTCIESIKRHGIPENVQIVVVDNGSTDGTVEYLQSFSWIKLILNRKNLGFSRGNNMALRSLPKNTDAILLNNDVEIPDPLWIEKLQDTVYQSERYGIAGCRIRRTHGGIFQHAGTYMPDKLFQGIQIGGGERDINQYSSIDRVVEGVVFACAYIKSKVLKRIGVLDENYFAYYEDTDYCFKAKVAGYETVVCGDLTILHHENVSTGINKVNFNSLYQKSKKVFLSKWKLFLEERYFSEINMITTFSAPMGYSTHAKLIAKSLELHGIKVHYRFAYGKNSAVPLDEPANLDTGDMVTNIIRSRPPKRGIPNLFYCQADAFSPIPGEYNIGFSMLETTGVPESWVEACNKMDEIWVPTPFSVWTFRRSGVVKPIRQLPLGLIDTHYFNPNIHAYPIDDFTFLSVFEWGERKAPEVLIKTFNSTFRADEPVVLICKYVNSDPGVVPGKIVEDLHLDPNGGRIVFSENEHVPYYQIAQLYRSADCFVLPTRGEGWGMPILEAMGCGLPVIASYWSGQQYFMTDANSYPLQVDLTPATAKCSYYHGFKWAEPDAVHLQHLLHHVYENQQEARQKGTRAEKDVKSYWNVNLMGPRIADSLEKSAVIKQHAHAAVPLPKTKIAIDISRTIGGQITGVGRYTLRLIEGLAELSDDNVPYEFELLPGFGEYVHPEYLRKYDYAGPRSPRFTVHRGPVPSFSAPDYHVPGVALVHCTSNVLPDAMDVPAVFTVYDLTFMTHKEHHTQENVDLCIRNFERAVERSVHFTPISHHTAGDLIRYFDINEDQITVVECGIPLGRFYPASDNRKHEIRSQYNLPDRYFLYVGSLEPRKNLISLLRAMDQYKGSEKLVIAGACGWQNHSVMDKIFSSGKCIFLDYVPDDALPALYSAALAFVYPSLYEGFGFPAVEAMACGVPVISSNNSSLKEIAEDAAILIDTPEDDRVLLQEMERIVDDEALKDNLISLGLERAKQYGIDRMSIKMISLYARLLSQDGVIE